jgi:hypothetical protein
MFLILIPVIREIRGKTKFVYCIFYSLAFTSFSYLFSVALCDLFFPLCQKKLLIF